MTDAGTRAARTLGIIGVGGMGGAMARRALAVGGRLVVHDIDPAAVAPLEAIGAVVARNPDEVAEQVDVVSVVVVDDDQVRQVVVPDHDVLWAIHSTVLPSTIEEVATRAEVIDAAVAGGQWCVEDGGLVVMVGGERTLLERARPALELFAGSIYHMGPLGSGVRTKIARNLLTLSELMLGREVSRLVEAAGIDGETFRRVVADSDKSIPVHGGLLLPTPFLAGDVIPMDTLIPIMRKDLLHAIEIGEILGAPTPIGRAAEANLEAMMPVGMAPSERGAR